MYFIECNHCGHHNHVKTEFQTFCEACGKKMANNFQEWKKVHSRQTFNDFKNEVCIRKENPRPKFINKKPGISKLKRDYIVLIASLVVFAVLGGIFGNRIADSVMEYVYRYSASSGGFRAVNPTNWDLVVADAGDFEIRFPGQPVKNEQNAKTQNGEIEVTLYTFEPKIGADNNLSYIIAHSDYPAYTVDSRYMTGIEIDQVLDQSIQGSAQSVQGSIISSKKIRLGSFPGKEFEISIQNGAAAIIGRSYLVNNTVYSLNVVEPSKNKSNASTKLFLDSFRLKE